MVVIQVQVGKNIVEDVKNEDVQTIVEDVQTKNDVKWALKPIKIGEILMYLPFKTMAIIANCPFLFI
jgi:hypothetical protein